MTECQRTEPDNDQIAYVQFLSSLKNRKIQEWKFNIQNYSEVIEIVIYKYKEKSPPNEGTILW